MRMCKCVCVDRDGVGKERVGEGGVGESSSSTSKTVDRCLHFYRES